MPTTADAATTPRVGLVVAYFGPQATFTEMALDRMLADPPEVLAGRDVTKLSCDSPQHAIAAVRDGRADYACVPIESSVEGSVPLTLDALVRGSRVQVFAEIGLDVAFTIAARTALPLDQVHTLAAFPVAAAQLRESVERLLPNAEFVTASSNSGAAVMVAEGGADAAVTTASAAQLYGLVSLADSVADIDDARTRFVLIGRPGPPPARTGADRTSVVFDLSNVPGSLMRAMDEFASRGIDLTRIESRPRRGAIGRYYFYIDAVGHLDDAAVAEALGALHRHAAELRYLGSWPAERPSGSAPPDHSASTEWLSRMQAGRD